jgi:hypothetical protein
MPSRLEAGNAPTIWTWRAQNKSLVSIPVIRFKRSLGIVSNDGFPTSQQHILARMFLVGVDVAGQDVFHLGGIVLLDKLAPGEGRFARHVLTGGIADDLIETQ